MRKCRLVLRLFLSLVVSSGCDSSEDVPGESTFRADTLDSGLVRIVNDGAGAWTQETAWRLEQDLRLGTVDRAGPEQFSQIAWIQEDFTGRIDILDYPAQDIRVFSREGEYSHTIALTTSVSFRLTPPRLMS